LVVWFPLVTPDEFDTLLDPAGVLDPRTMVRNIAYLRRFESDLRDTIVADPKPCRSKGLEAVPSSQGEK
jgi:hypothetical protein